MKKALLLSILTLSFFTQTRAQNCTSFSATVQATQTTCGLPNGSLVGNATGGVTPYTYLWSNGATAATLQNLNAGTYTLTVTASNGCTATASATLSNSICPKVNTAATVSNITQNGATINWPAISCANKYRVVVKNVSTGVQTTTIVSATTFNLSGLLPSTNYQVRIRTQCSQNGSVLSQFSPIASFTTLNSQGIQCLPPSIINPVVTTTTTATINWNAAAGAVQYNIRYRTTGTTAWTALVIAGTITGTTIQNLIPGTAYEYQIRTKCNSNPDEFSPYSAILSFSTTLVGVISTLGCADAVNNGTLTAGSAANSVSSVVPYNGGNGGTHNGQTVTSTGVTGLTATLTAGTFANGSGSLTYTISGTPASSGTASFALSIGGKTCTLTRTVVAGNGTITSLTCALGSTLGGFKIKYNATTGITGLAGSPTVYCHSGAGIVAGTAWTYVVGNWGQADGVGQMTMDGVNIWTLTLNDPIAYYSAAPNGPIPAGESIFRIGMVFRNADGTLEGKDDYNNDIFVDFNEDGSIISSFPGVSVEYNTAATNNGTLTSGIAASGVSSVVPYTGGNGGTHNGQTVTSTGVTGLTATLTAGTFANGSGSLTYTISGTPVSSGTASFALSIGGQTCTLTRTVNANGQTGITAHTCGATNVHNPSKTYGTMTDQQGNVYKTIVIGTQEWMAENLKTTIYRNGNAIANVTGNNQWADLTTGAWCYYNNNSQYDCPYGKLYNWYAVADSRNVCPTGWHVPTDAEWTTLTSFLGGETVAGGKMKSTGLQYWLAPNDFATNESGFSGLPGGNRDGLNGYFYGVGYYGYWWSSPESSTTGAWYRYLSYDDGNAYRYGAYKRDGFSVRCLKD